MGRGEIVSHDGDGLYTVKLKYNRATIDAEKARIVTRIAEIDATEIPAVNAAITTALVAFNEANFNLITKIEATDPEDPSTKEAVKKAQTEQRIAEGTVNQLRAQLAQFELEKVSKQTRLDYINANVPETDPEVQAWCADLTEDLTGDVGTIEPPDEKVDTPVIIRPGFTSAVFDAALDGQLKSPAMLGPAEAFYNRALLPGVQRWRPLYRLGEITEIDGDACTVALDDVKSSAQDLPINETASVSCAINYMDCDGAAFEVGDRVVVMFSRDWGTPIVIGFESDPAACAVEADLILFSSTAEDTRATIFNSNVGRQVMSKMTGYIIDDHHPFFNRVSHESGIEYSSLIDKNIKINNSKTIAVELNNAVSPATPVAYDEKYEIEYSIAGGAVYANDGTTSGPVVEAGPLTLLDTMTTPQKGQISIAGKETAKPWNRYQGARGLTLNQTDGTVSNTWQWLPSFFVVEPESGSGVSPGWYYGKGPYYGSEYDLLFSLKACDVSLLAIMQTRHKGLPAKKVKTGWIEMVTMVNDGSTENIDEEKGDIYVYTNSVAGEEQLGGISHIHDYYERVAGSSSLTVGTVLRGFDAFSRLSAKTVGVKPDKIDFWNFNEYVDEDNPNAEHIGGICVFIVESGQARLFRGIDSLLLVNTYQNYHSHSISHDGGKIAIFYGALGISSCDVYDLAGTRVDIKIPGEYNGKQETLVFSGAVGDYAPYFSGAIIPTRAAGFEEKNKLLIPSSGAQPDQNDITDYFPSLSTLRYDTGCTPGVLIYKLTCDNGVDAFFRRYYPCEQTTIYVDNPLTVEDRDTLVSTWSVPDYNRYGLIRGSFSPSSITPNFNGVDGGETLMTITKPGGEWVDNDDFTPGGCGWGLDTIYGSFSLSQYNEIWLEIMYDTGAERGIRLWGARWGASAFYDNSCTVCLHPTSYCHLTDFFTRAVNPFCQYKEITLGEDFAIAQEILNLGTFSQTKVCL